MQETAVDGSVLWLDSAAGAPEVTPGPAVRGTVDADVCIVGGGLLGLWTALKIVEDEPGTEVAVLEARTCGFGASGRNAGFAMTLWSKASSLISRVGKDEAARLARASQAGLDEIGSFCESEGIDCGFRMPGWLWTATSMAQVGSARSTVEAAESLGGDTFETIGKEELRERLGSPNVYGGVYETRCATVDPARLVLGLRAAALRRGVRIYEYSPVVGIDRESQTVRCPLGEVRSRQLVLATNAWLSKLRELRRVIVPVSADAIATEPIPAFFATRWSGGEAWTNSNMIIDYARPTEDGRIVIGRGAAAIAYAGHMGSGFLQNPPRTREIFAALTSLFPALDETEVTHSWSGPVDRTFDGLPIIGRLPRSNALFCAGFSGNGVGPTYVFARMLASLALGKQDEWSSSAYVGMPEYRFPPEPVRYLGARLIRHAIRTQIEAADSGRPLSPLMARIVSLGPPGLTMVKS